MKDFKELGLPEALMHTLESMEFTTPTPIQAQAIPPAMEGRDILGSAQTGTGKTGAFGIPLAAKLMESRRGSAMILTPTRELAMQVQKQIQAMLGKRSRIKTALLIGGESMPRQINELRNNPRVIVGTPGRVNDHLERGTLLLHDTGFLVLDETDRMLDMGFQVQIERVLKFMPKQRQTLLFSATLPKNIVGISKKYLNDPVRVAVAQESQAAKNITHEVIRVSDGEKYQELVNQLNTRTGSIIIFIKTKHGADKMAIKLSRSGHSAEAIHGDLRQSKRDRVIKEFRAEKHRILVATDVAARGLDIPHIEHVINYDLPQSPEDYIHRIGRTARAGAEGEAMAFVTPKDKLQWGAIAKLLGKELLGDDAKDADDAPSSSRAPRGRSGEGRGGPRNGARSGGGRNSRDGGKPSGPRRSGGDRKRSSSDDSKGGRDGDRKPRRSDSEGDSRPRRANADSRKPRRDDAKGDTRPARRDGAKKPRDGEARRSRPEGKPARSESRPARKDGSDFKKRDGDKKPRSNSGDKPRRSESRPPRKDGGKPAGRSGPRNNDGAGGNRPPRRRTSN